MEWKVLTVRWCDDSGEVVVWYYDILEAENGDISEEDMTAAIESGSSFDCFECFLNVLEIKPWVSGGGLGRYNVYAVPNSPTI